MSRKIFAISMVALQLSVLSTIIVAGPGGRGEQNGAELGYDDRESTGDGVDAKLFFTGDPMSMGAGAPQLVVSYSPIIVKIVLGAEEAEEIAAELEDAIYYSDYYADGEDQALEIPQRLSLVIRQVLRALDSAGLGESGTLVQLPPYNVNFIVEEPQEEDDGDAEGT